MASKKPGGLLETQLNLDGSAFVQGANAAKKSMEGLQQAVKDSNANLQELKAQLDGARAAAIAAGQKLDTAVGQEFRKNIAQAKAQVSGLTAEMAKLQAANGGKNQKDGNLFGLGNVTGKLAGIGLAVQGAKAAFDAAALAVNAFMEPIERLAALQDMAEITGDTASNLSTLAGAAAASGTSMESISSAMNKMNKELNNSGGATSNAAKGLTALGLSYEDFIKLNPAERMKALAEAFAQFKDGPEKSAVAMAIMGKSGAELIPFLNDLNEGIGVNNKLTNEQVAAADELSKRWAILKRQSAASAESMAGELAPAFLEILGITQDLIKFFKDLGGATNFVGEASTYLVAAGKGLSIFLGTIGTLTMQAVVAVNTLFDALQNLGKGDFSKAADSLKKGFDKIGAMAEANGKRISDIVDGTASAASARSAFAATDPRLQKSDPKSLSTKGLGTGADKDARGQEKASKDAFRARLEQLKAENQLFIASLAVQTDAQERAYRDGQTSLEAYNAQRLDALKQRNAQEAKLIDEEIAASQKELNQAGASAERKAELSNQIRTLTAQRTKAEIEAQRSVNTELDAGTLRLESYAKRLNDLKAQAATITGDYAGARTQTSAGIDQKYAKERGQVAEGGNSAELAALDRVIEAEKAAAEATLIRLERAAGIRDIETQIVELQAQQSAGTISNLEYENQYRDLQTQRLEKERAINVEILARGGLSADATNELQAKVKQTDSAVRGLGTGMISLSKTFDDTLQNSLVKGLGDIVSGAESAKDAIRGIGKSLLDAVANAALQNAVKGLMSSFGGGAGSGGGGGLFASLASAFGFADGGIVPRVAGANNGPKSDGVAARLSPGEVVINNRAADLLGRGWLNSLNQIQSAAGMAAQMKAPRVSMPAVASRTNALADGGIVGNAAIPAGSSAMVNKVEIINNTSSPAVISSVEQERQLGAAVTRIILRDVKEGGSMTKAISSATKQRN
jgi:hypothetical protein